MEPRSPPDLAALLASPPPGVAVRQGLDRAEIRLLKASWLQERGMFQPIGELGSQERRAWWRTRLIALLSGAIPPILWKSGYTVADPQVWLLIFCVSGAAILLSVCAAVAVLAALLDRLLATLRPGRISLAAQRLRIEEIGAARELPLDAIRSVAGRLWGGGLDSPGERLAVLHIQAFEESYTLLTGAHPEQMGWLVQVIEAAVAQRRSALLAAGHEEADLPRPPAEAEALRALAEGAGARPRSGL